LHRRTFLTAAASVPVLDALSAGVAVSALASEWSAIRQAAQALVSERYTPGLSIAVMRDGEFLFSEAFGHANLETETPVSTASVFKIASVTKQMTSAAILLLQQDGALSLSDPLSKWIPEFPRSDEITLYQLATHTSGLGSFNRLASRQIDRLREYDDQEYLELMLRTEPMFVSEPGEAEVYSNTGYGLLGIVIGRSSGRHYSEFFADRLFAPIGLKHTRVDDLATVIPGRVDGYSPNRSTASGFERSTATSASYPGPAGAVVSTAQELCQWHHALVFGDLLTAESLRLMLAPVQLGSEYSYYGMGVNTRFTRAPFAGRNVVSHGGRLLGFASDLWSFPEKRVTVATLMNSDGGDRNDFGRRFDGLRDPATLQALDEV